MRRLLSSLMVIIGCYFAYALEMELIPVILLIFISNVFLFQMCKPHLSKSSDHTNAEFNVHEDNHLHVEEKDDMSNTDKEITQLKSRIAAQEIIIKAYQTTLRERQAKVDCLDKHNNRLSKTLELTKRELLEKKNSIGLLNRQDIELKLLRRERRSTISDHIRAEKWKKEAARAYAKAETYYLRSAKKQKKDQTFDRRINHCELKDFRDERRL
jgi:uncharacterized coiled-coil protein SlyX